MIIENTKEILSILAVHKKLKVKVVTVSFSATRMFIKSNNLTSITNLVDVDVNLSDTNSFKVSLSQFSSTIKISDKIEIVSDSLWVGNIKLDNVQDDSTCMNLNYNAPLITECEIDSKKFLLAFNTVKGCLKYDKTRPYLSNLYVLDNKLIATDGARLSSTDIDLPDLCLPYEVTYLTPLFKNSSIEISIYNDCIKITTDKIRFIAEVDFECSKKDLDRAEKVYKDITTSVPAIQSKIDKKQILAYVSYANLYLNKTAILNASTAHGLTITNNLNIAVLSSDLPNIEYESTFFNTVYIENTLKKCKSDSVSLSLHNEYLIISDPDSGINEVICRLR